MSCDVQVSIHSEINEKEVSEMANFNDGPKPEHIPQPEQSNQPALQPPSPGSVTYIDRTDEFVEPFGPGYDPHRHGSLNK